MSPARPFGVFCRVLLWIAFTDSVRRAVRNAASDIRHDWHGFITGKVQS